jgi:hypothetical protein
MLCFDALNVLANRSKRDLEKESIFACRARLKQEFL